MSTTSSNINIFLSKFDIFFVLFKKYVVSLQLEKRIKSIEYG